MDDIINDRTERIAAFRGADAGQAGAVARNSSSMSASTR